jgi:hypothetical protein
MWSTILLVSALIAPAPVFSPEGPTGTGAAEREAMKRLDFIVGEWKGEGTFRSGPGPGEKAQVVEKAETRLDGLVLLFEGVGTAKAADGTETIVHHALGVLNYDAKQEMYLMRAIKSDGTSVDAQATFVGDVFVWGFEVPGGRVRYTIRLTPEGRWHEVGGFSRDAGKTYTPFFEMTLEKVAKLTK